MNKRLLGCAASVLACAATTASAQLGNVVFNPQTGNYYAAYAVPNDGDILWDDARIAAEQLTHNGIPGHLATLHTPEENAFIVDNFYDAVHDMYWLGGYQVLDTAPEADPGADWMWVTGEPWSWTNWLLATGEPNDSGGYGEDVLRLWRKDWWREVWNMNHPLGEWNDEPFDIPAPGYIVEFSVYFHPQVPPCSAADLTTQGAAPGDPLDGVPDGIVSGTDISYYVNAWVTGDLATADRTTQGTAPGDALFGVPDGAINGADINFYVNEWVLGCP